MRTILLTAIFLILVILSNEPAKAQGQPQRIRKPVDTVGFATHARQMDTLMKRISTNHGWLYPAILQNIHAGTVILFGVAHKAKKFNLERKIIFDSFDAWKEPYGFVTVSQLREQIMKELPQESYVVHDSMQQEEHSVEAIIPFLQYQNKNIRIISILVPYMTFSLMDKISGDLSSAISKVLQNNKLKLGKDVAFVISTDAVHYGDEDWGGSNYAPYGCALDGFAKAYVHEQEIISCCLTGPVTTEKVRSFVKYTVKEEDYKSYKWTWCGRYSVPFGLLSVMKIHQKAGKAMPAGTIIGYKSSISEPPIPVSDIGMGKTAVATLHHWVGYCAIGYK